MVFALVTLYAQKPVTLEFESHAIKNESDNNMQLCKYAEPGEGGENVIWDFSNLQSINDFTGFVKSSYQSVNSALFPRANTELNEFENRFYFRIAENCVEQLGYSSRDNVVVTSFDKPFVKMIYPFTMGDHFNGTFEGTYKMGTVSSKLAGSYEVTADGYGTLMLPDNFIVDNTLRVSTTKSYSYKVNGSDNLYEIVTYRWYSDWYRYPLLVLTKIKTSVNQSSSVSYQAAFNNQLSIPAVSNEVKISAGKLFDVYPNPVNSVLNISCLVEIEGTVLISLYDLSGKLIKVLHNEEMSAGPQKFSFDLNESGISEGPYLLKANISGGIQTKQILIEK